MLYVNYISIKVEKSAKKRALIVSHFIQEGKQIHNFCLSLFIMQSKTKGQDEFSLVQKN